MKPSNVYPSFGMVMQERSFSNPVYRFGFNGKEKNDEINVEGGDYDFGARIYDSRLGRWLSLDAYKLNYPSHSNFSFGLNNPNCFTDCEGNYIVDKDGNIVKFKIKKNGQVKFKSSVDPFTKQYILSMAKTETSKATLIKLKDAKDRKVEVRLMSEQENEILRTTQNGSFESISGVTLSKMDYANLDNYANGKIDESTYNSNVKQITKEGYIENGGMNPSVKIGRIEMDKDPVQYSDQVILINETPINKNTDPIKEFLMTATEETEHSLQNYIEVIPGGVKSEKDYNSLRHEKEAKEVAVKAGNELDTKRNKTNE